MLALTSVPRSASRSSHLVALPQRPEADERRRWLGYEPSAARTAPGVQGLTMRTLRRLGAGVATRERVEAVDVEASAPVGTELGAHHSRLAMPTCVDNATVPRLWGSKRSIVEH